MGWFTSKRAKASAAEAAALAELTGLIRSVTTDAPGWVCAECAVKDGHRHGCRSANVSPPRLVTAREEFDLDDDEDEEPTVVAYLPLDWRDQVASIITDPSERDRAVGLLDEWDRPHALDPGDAMLEGMSDAYSIHAAYLWGSASVASTSSARAALVKAGVDAEENARRYRRMQTRHRAPSAAASISPCRALLAATDPTIPPLT